MPVSENDTFKLSYRHRTYGLCLEWRYDEGRRAYHETLRQFSDSLAEVQGTSKNTPANFLAALADPKIKAALEEMNPRGAQEVAQQPAHGYVPAFG